jgi:hypothetical protein
MKMKSIKIMLAGILAVPIMALGLSFTGMLSQPVSAVNFNSGAAGGASSAQGAGQPSDLFGNGGIFQKITNIALYLIGAISVLMLIYGGIRYTISGGDSKNVTAAKNTILYAIVGIVVAILAFAIVNFVITSLTPVA